MNKKECIAAVNRRFSEYKSQNRAEEARRRREVAEALPAYGELDRQLQATHREFFRFFADRDPDESRFEAFRKRSLDLQEQQRRLLEAHGWPADYLDPVYRCAQCHDEGAVEGVLCACYKRALSQEYLKASGMDGLFRERTFETFDGTLYPENAREQMQKLLDFSKKYVRDFSPSSPSLLFAGEPGCGKTFLSVCIGCELIRKGVFVLYAPVQTMMADFEAETFRNGDAAPDLPTSEYLEAELLIIDDLGTEFYNSFAESKLYEIINTRLVRKRPTLISTNLTSDEREGVYSPRLNSRLSYEYMNLTFPAADLRRAKKERRSRS